jgi:hypothetical protein
MMSKLRNTSHLTSHARNVGRSLAAVAVAAVAAFVTACSDAPSATAPATAPTSLRLSKSSGGPGETQKVNRAAPLGAPVTVSYHIDPKQNGTFELPGTGLEIEVPKGAVSEPVTITATALPGAALAYRFEPHGLVFRRPLHARQDLDALAPQTRSQLGSLLSSLLSGGQGSSQLEIGYFADESALAGGETVTVNEFLGSVLDLPSNRVEFDIEHFSGYMVAWGRSRYY